MIAGLWMTPALLAGLFAILWVTTRLERLVVAPVVGGEIAHPPSVATASAPVAAGAATRASPDTSSPLGTRPRTTSTRRGGGTMYIGGGTIVLILIIIVVVMLMRGR